jgi:hypothetical protein
MKKTESSLWDFQVVDGYSGSGMILFKLTLPAESKEAALREGLRQWKGGGKQTDSSGLWAGVSFGQVRQGVYESSAGERLYLRFVYNVQEFEITLFRSGKTWISGTALETWQYLTSNNFTLLDD